MEMKPERTDLVLALAISPEASSKKQVRTRGALTSQHSKDCEGGESIDILGQRKRMVGRPRELAAEASIGLRTGKKWGLTGQNWGRSGDL